MPFGTPTIAVEGKELKATVQVPSQPTELKAEIVQEPWLLSENQYKTLGASSGVFGGLGAMFLLASLGFVTEIVVGLAGQQNQNAVPLKIILTTPNLIKVGLPLVLALFFFSLAPFFSLEKWKLGRKIKKHFKEKPETSRIVQVKQ